MALLAETRRRAFDDCRERMPTFSGLGLLGVSLNGTDHATLPEQSVEVGGAIIGTPDDAIEAIETLLSGSGPVRDDAGQSRMGRGYRRRTDRATAKLES